MADFGNRAQGSRVEARVQTLPSRIEAATSRGGDLTFVGVAQPDTVSWAELHDDARAMAIVLQSMGVAPGDHVALLGPTSRPLVTALQAVWLAGATVVMLPLPMRVSSVEELLAQTRRHIVDADVTLVAVDAELAPFLEPAPGDPAWVVLGDLAERASRRRAEAGAWERPEDDLDRLAILQFTSGSTSDPKGVMLPDRVVGANLDAIAEAGHLDREHDVLVSWLPLYHDMGLVGMLSIPMTTGCDLVLGAPQDFMASPAQWMRWLSDHHGTVTAGPNFAYALATRALRRLDGLDLSGVRLALNGAEPVSPATMQAFVEAGERHGLRPEAIFPAFGMAELAIAGAFCEPGSGLRVDTVDRRVLEVERYAAPVAEEGSGTGDRRHDHQRNDRVRSLAMLGRPVPGLEMRVVDPDSGKERHEREVGELEVRGTSLTTGYYRRPEATAAAFHDGWLRTGDLAYLVGGELVMCGRIKDVIIVAGRNVFPEDIELAAAEVDGVRAGNVIAFGVDGRRGVPSVVVVAESKAEEERRDDVRRAVASKVRTASGVATKEIVLVAPGSLPKTSSGKLQRSLCKQRWDDHQLVPA